MLGMARRDLLRHRARTVNVVGSSQPTRKAHSSLPVRRIKLKRVHGVGHCRRRVARPRPLEVRGRTIGEQHRSRTRWAPVRLDRAGVGLQSPCEVPVAKHGVALLLQCDGGGGQPPLCVARMPQRHSWPVPPPTLIRGSATSTSVATTRDRMRAAVSGCLLGTAARSADCTANVLRDGRGGLGRRRQVRACARILVHGPAENLEDRNRVAVVVGGDGGPCGIPAHVRCADRVRPKACADATGFIRVRSRQHEMWRRERRHHGAHLAAHAAVVEPNELVVGGDDNFRWVHRIHRTVLYLPCGR
mmetsp:Transcript_18204/g.64532  ORF Transcript_18204/g.64532 Transcript_18204/m.64532 type:complete len:302 (+) Transcript_18204:294-1199(+)